MQATTPRATLAGVAILAGVIVLWQTLFCVLAGAQFSLRLVALLAAATVLLLGLYLLFWRVMTGDGRA